MDIYAVDLGTTLVLVEVVLNGRYSSIVTLRWPIFCFFSFVGHHIHANTAERLHLTVDKNLENFYSNLSTIIYKNHFRDPFPNKTLGIILCLPLLPNIRRKKLCWVWNKLEKVVNRSLKQMSEAKGIRYKTYIKEYMFNKL